MPKGMRRIIIGIIGMIFLAGCGVSVRTYTKQVKRVDQEMTGNAGYLVGTPKYPDRRKLAKTRPHFVIEIEKGAPPVTGEETVSEPTAPITEMEEQQASSSAAGIYEQGKMVSSPTPESKEEYTLYTVQKNDTLQKISKKFYDTYRKWPQIYEANKDILTNPNKIKPGLTIKIPTLK